MSAKCYARFPSIFGAQIVFVAEDDLWIISDEGGIPRRLTSNLGEVSRPAISPDGEWIAFTGREEGPSEVFVMPMLGGPAKRLTFLGSANSIAGWTSDSEKIIFASNAGTPFGRSYQLFEIDLNGGTANSLPYGSAQSIAFGTNGEIVIGRFTGDSARWKRYRGGTAGVIWIETDQNGIFNKLINLDGNLADPMWINDRVYFLSDHEGYGNVYSCETDGSDLKRHTDHGDFYARNASTDGKRIIYHAGADLYICDPEINEIRKVEIDFRSPRVQRNRKFVDTSRHIETFDLDPKNESIAIVSRGQSFTMGNWEGSVTPHGKPNGTRYRLTRWLNDGDRLVSTTDENGDEKIQMRYTDESKEPEILDLDIGRSYQIEVSPKADQIAVSNHRNELIMIDLESKELKILDRSEHNSIRGFEWSPDGKWIAYGFATTQNTSEIRLVELETGEKHSVTKPILRDFSPAFDPEGKYLYFLSQREFNPIYDSLHFDLAFPRGMRPYLITLKADLESPFVAKPKPLVDPKKKDNNSEKNDEKNGDPENGEKSDDEKKEKEKDEEKPIEIDFDGITDRVVAVPVKDGRYGQIAGIKNKILFISIPIAGSDAKKTLEVYDLEKREKEKIATDVSDFRLSRDRKVLAYRSGNRIRVIKAGDKAPDKDKKTRIGGWIDLNRIKISIDPPSEWRQMFREAWRLQRDHFWVEDMSNIDWETIYDRYLPLVDRVATRSEFSDLMWEMQGELGTSHAYESGGDYRPNPHNYGQGFLGATFKFDPKDQAYEITHIISGDVWQEGKDSPLNAPGINVKIGDKILAINGQRLDHEITPQQLLVNHAGQEISLTLKNEPPENDDPPSENGDQDNNHKNGDENGDEKKPTRIVTVKAIGSEKSAIYREWVSRNRQIVHDRTDGRVGYVHIPDMGVNGYAEFHRSYLAEIDCDALIVDVRCNGGGHVSQLILEKLARKRIGYDLQRWGKPFPYPGDSVLGPMIAVTDELAGSDGDIFSHCWKLMKLGKLIGKRTWGGVIGISPKHRLVDGSTTTQPEYSFWFEDVEWGVENYGTDPDIEIEFAPHDYVADRDPQLDRAIDEILQAMEVEPPKIPELGNRPNLELPKLPPRSE